MRPNFDHVLKKNDNLNMQRHFLFFDTETREEINESSGSLFGLPKERILNLKMGWGVYWDRETDYREEKFFTTYEDFWRWADDLPVKDIMVFAHNTGFDMKVTNGYKVLLGERKYGIRSFYIKDAIYKLEVEKVVAAEKPYKKKIRIYDTMNFVGMKLEALGKSVGLEKGKVDFGSVSAEELKAYCLNDVLIIEKFIRGLVKFLEEYDLSKLTSTGASLAFNIFRHKFYDPHDIPFMIHANPAAVRLERASYHGGITDCFSVGKMKGDFLKVDINSMYPWVMREFDVPTKKIFYESGDMTRLMEYHLKQFMEGKNHYLGIARCDIELPEEHAYILVKYERKKEKKCGFVKGRFTAALTWPELAFVKKHGKILNCSELCLYEHHNMFRSYVDFFYGIRLKAKKEKNPMLDLFGKLCMNKLYGKFGQRRCGFERMKTRRYEDGLYVKKGEDYFHFADDAEGYEERIFHTEEGSERYLWMGKDVMEVSRSEENSFDSFVAVASYVTAYARMRLVDLILKVGREKCHYCDTDSLILDSDGETRIKDDLHDTELGKLKVEGKAADIEIWRPKYYRFGDEFKCKGMRKNSRKIWEDEDRIIVVQDQFEGFNSSIKKDSLDFQRISLVVKELSKGYNKGHVEGGRVRPYDAKQISIY